MTEKIPVRVQHKRMTKSQWLLSDVILLDGEIGVESDTGYLKVGDGKSPFPKLKYLTGDKGAKGDKGDPFTYDDLTEDQIAELRGKEIDLSNYATKEQVDALSGEVDKSRRAFETLDQVYAKKHHTHETIGKIYDEHSREWLRVMVVPKDGVPYNTRGLIVFEKE